MLRWDNSSCGLLKFDGASVVSCEELNMSAKQRLRVVLISVLQLVGRLGNCQCVHIQ